MHRFSNSVDKIVIHSIKFIQMGNECYNYKTFEKLLVTFIISPSAATWFHQVQYSVTFYYPRNPNFSIINPQYTSKRVHLQKLH